MYATVISHNSSCLNSTKKLNQVPFPLSKRMRYLTEGITFYFGETCFQLKYKPFDEERSSKTIT